MSKSVPAPVRIAQRIWRRTVQFHYWTVQTVYRTRHGHLRPFMDAPDWFVRVYTIHTAGHDLSFDPWFEIYANLARSEMRMRRSFERTDDTSGGLDMPDQPIPETTPLVSWVHVTYLRLGIRERASSPVGREAFADGSGHILLPLGELPFWLNHYPGTLIISIEPL